MNTRQKAKDQIIDFINSDRRCLLLTGTHMFEKHNLVLSILGDNVMSKEILFRTNALKDLSLILDTSIKNFKTGTAYGLGSSDLYFDSFDIKTWTNSPDNLDFAIIYPIGSLITRNGFNKSPIDNIFNKGSRSHKVFLIGSHENYNFSLFDEYVDQKVIFDVEEEDIEYHKRVIESLR